MSKNYFSLGLMSGTSGDGVDASIIKSDGQNQYETVLDKYFEYSVQIQENIHTLKDKIANSSEKLIEFSKEISSLERSITLFHAEAANEVLKVTKEDIDFIGFHGQTILHSPSHSMTKQLGDGKLLSQLTKKKVIYDFRQNDLKNGGHGAPLSPIFHKLLKEKFKIKKACFVNLGGIINTTSILDNSFFSGCDIGPGMCLIDQWIRHNSEKKYDEGGIIAKSGKVNKIVLKKLIESLNQKKEELLTTSPYVVSYDVKDFDLSFVKGLSLKDGAATLVQFTINTIYFSFKIPDRYEEEIILCGGGRKNKFLVEKLKEDNARIKLIDDYGVDGDFVESQAFAYLAIRSYLKLPISFPETTGCNKPCTGGVIIENF